MQGAASLPRRILPFLGLSVLVSAVAVLLVLSLQEPSSSPLCGPPGTLLIGTGTADLSAPQRSLQETVTFMDNTTVKITTSTFVLAVNQTHAELATIIGNFSYTELGPGRLLSDSDNSNVKLDAVPLLRITAIHSTGEIVKVEKTSGTDDLSATFGLNVVRSILVNQDVNSYSQLSGKRTADSPDCVHTETLHDEVYCPEFSVHSSATSTTYTRKYSTESARSRRLSDDAELSMNVEIASSVDAKTGLLQRADTFGEVSFAIFKSDNGTSTATLSHRTTTTFEVLPDFLTPQDLESVSEIINASNFTKLTSTNSTYNATGVTRYLEERGLAGPMTSSKVVKLCSLIGVNVNLVTTMTINTDTLRVLLILDLGGVIRYDLADKTFGGPVVQSIWKVLGLRDLAKTKLEELLAFVNGYVKEIQNTIKGSVLQKIGEVKAKVDEIKAAFTGTVQQLQAQLDGYKAQVQAIADSAKTQFESAIASGQRKIAAVQAEVDTAISDFKDSVQAELDGYQQQFEDAQSKVKQTVKDLEELKNSALSHEQLTRIATNTGLLDQYNTVKATYEAKLADAQAQIANFVEQETAKADALIGQATAAVNQQAFDLQQAADVVVQKFSDGYQEAMGTYGAAKSAAEATIAQLQSEIDAAMQLVQSPEKIAKLANLTTYLDQYNQKKAEAEASLAEITTTIDQFRAQKQAEADALIATAKGTVDAQVASLQQAADQKIQQFKTTLQPTVDMFQSTITDAKSKVASAVSTIESIKNEVLTTASDIAKMANLTDFATTVKAEVATQEANLRDEVKLLTDYATEQRAAVAISADYFQSSVSESIAELRGGFDATIQEYKDTFAQSLSDLSSQITSVSASITQTQTQITQLQASAESAAKTAQLAALNTALASYQQQRTQLQTSVDAIQSQITTFENEQLAVFAELTDPLLADVADNVAAARANAEQLIADFKAARQGVMDGITTLLDTAKSKVGEVAAGIDELRNTVLSPSVLTKIASTSTTLKLLEAKKAEAERLVSSVVTKVENFVEEKKAAVKGIIASVQSAVDATKAKLSAIADGSFSWQDEFEKVGLTVVQDILEPFKDAKDTFLAQVRQIQSLGLLLASVVGNSAQAFQGKVSTTSGVISTGFGNISAQKSTSAVADANIFDFTFFDSLFSSIKETLKTVSSTVNGVKDLLNGDILTVVSDLTQIVNPEQWLTVFSSVKQQITSIQEQFKFLKSAPDVTEQWLKDTVSSLKAAAVEELKNVNIVQIASQLAPALTSTLLSGVADVSKIKDKLISDFLGKVLIPPQKFTLFRLSNSVPLCPAIPTPIGPILVSWGYDVRSEIAISITLDSSQLVATVDPSLAASLYVSAAWNILIAEVGAKAGVTLSGDLPASVGMKRTLRGVFTNIDLNYYAGGQFSMYYKYRYPTFWSYCWSVRITRRLSITLCIYWIVFVWSPPKNFLQYNFGASGTVAILRKSF